MLTSVSDQAITQLAGQSNVQVLVFSDSHGQWEPIDRIFRKQKGIDLVLHLGDHCAALSDLAWMLDLPLLGVSGNCDGHLARHLPDHLLLTISGRRLFLTHGHQYGVKRQLDQLIQAASDQPNCADIILFGHTHQYFEKNINQAGRPVLLINPGSARANPYGGNATAALLRFDQSGVSCEMLLDQI